MKEQSLCVGSLDWFYREVTPINDLNNVPVLLLHGLPAQSYTWRGVMDILGDNGFRAIAPDWIGSGFSAKPDKRDFPYTSSAYQEALGALIEALELEKLSLVVQGFLASVALQYALTHPEKIERLIILNTPLSPTVKLPWAMQQWALPFVGDMVTQDPLLVDRTLEGGSGFVISDEDLAVYRQPFLKSSSVGRALLSTTKNLKLSQTMVEIETGLGNWQHPTLIIWGMADPWLSADIPQKLAANHSNIEFVKLEEAKHYPQEHWPKEVGAEIVNFLRRQV
ncbi:alpha/beta fold hydrolase [Crocosphaera sp. XPORK-15E]|uniref:alpha/beta fold hydrolase n=1 Tax=Crocosphaera sp. XPORK-15E TaxID=3110247 RepID=UPI002B1FFA18|nr:alpha/beta fold hydrolase [Crocosphaera sp. XPORK-15E]MEA5535757.1 alpha/beta fold hydrolase [Crocosphaera sp. XPORK-15E]